LTIGLPHDESGDCLPCAARIRKTKHAHDCTMGVERQLYCKKCGLLESQWAGSSKCRGNGKKYVAPQEARRATILFPLNWD